MQTIVVLALALLVACGDVPGPSDILEPEDLAGVAEAYCSTHPELPCGHVYQCDVPAENPLGLMEVCVRQGVDPIDNESYLYKLHNEFPNCKPSTDPRFAEAGSWLCWHCCGAGCGAGCNAYGGTDVGSCYCPGSLAPPPAVDAGVLDAYVNDLPPNHP